MTTEEKPEENGGTPKKRAVIYCVCDRAELGVCDECKKYQEIKPTHTLNNPTWKRKLS